MKSNRDILRAAIRLWGNSRNAREWIAAVRYLKQRRLWLLDKRVERQG